MTDSPTPAHPASQEPPAPRLAIDDRRDQIFNGTKHGYEVLMPGVWLGGDIHTGYTDDGNWFASTEYHDHTYRGTGNSLQQAVLAMVAVRLGYPDPGHLIKAARDWRTCLADESQGDRDLTRAADTLIAAVDDYTAKDTAW